jgi:hypothetical protein
LLTPERLTAAGIDCVWATQQHMQTVVVPAGWLAFRVYEVTRARRDSIDRNSRIHDVRTGRWTARGCVVAGVASGTTRRSAPTTGVAGASVVVLNETCTNTGVCVHRDV